MSTTLKIAAAGIALCILLLGVFVAGRMSNDTVQIADNSSDVVPVVIRTNGGLLEVGTIKQRRNFDLTKSRTLFGQEVPFCKEAAGYTATVYTTYRVKLAKRWNTSYANGRLLVTAPALEPSLPVAFDTKGLRKTLSDCMLMPSLGTDEELLQDITSRLEKTAKSKDYKDLIRDKGARDTVREFVQKWLVTQEGYDLPANTPIDVEFADE